MAASHSGHSYRLVPCVTFHMIIDTAPWLVPWFLLCPLSLLNTATTVILKYKSGTPLISKPSSSSPKHEMRAKIHRRARNLCIVWSPSPLPSFLLLPFPLFTRSSHTGLLAPSVCQASPISGHLHLLLHLPRTLFHMSAALLTEIFPTQTASLLPSCTHPWPFPTAQILPVCYEFYSLSGFPHQNIGTRKTRTISGLIHSCFISSWDSAWHTVGT